MAYQSIYSGVRYESTIVEFLDHEDVGYVPKTIRTKFVTKVRNFKGMDPTKRVAFCMNMMRKYPPPPVPDL